MDEYLLGMWECPGERSWDSNGGFERASEESDWKEVGNRRIGKIEGYEFFEYAGSLH